MRDHDLIEELLAANALGGLDAGDERALRAEMAEHGDACDDCRGLEREYGEVAAGLALALEPVAVPTGMEEGLLERARNEGGPETLTTAPSARLRRIPEIRLRPLVAVAASVALIVGGWVLGNQLGGQDGAAIPPGARVVAFQGEPGTGSLSVAYVPGEAGVYVIGADLPVLPEGQVYEVWMIQGETPIPGPCLRPAADGSLSAYVDAELGTTDLMAVTVEPETCSTAPTSDPIFVAEIAPA